jgi:chitin disaccharide deacetylase
MDEATLIAALQALPPGLTEIYLHPATRSGAAIAASMPAYRHADELAALLSPRVAAQLAAAPTPRGGYGDWLRLHGARNAA